MFKTIVWATDGSEHADRALSYARSLARERTAKLVVVHVVEKYVGGRARGLPVHADEDLIQTTLDELEGALLEEGLDATLKVVPHFGSQPAHQIADIAREVEADLIVVGTRGRTAMGGVLLGSVTTRLLHLTPCPVLAVPAAAHASTREDRAWEVAHTHPGQGSFDRSTA